MKMTSVAKVVLAVAMLLTISWPAAAQARVEGTVARLELNILTLESMNPAAESDVVVAGLADDGAERPETEVAPVTTPATADGPAAVSSWGSRAGAFTVRAVRTVIPKMSGPVR